MDSEWLKSFFHSCGEWMTLWKGFIQFQGWLWLYLCPIHSCWKGKFQEWFRRPLWEREVQNSTCTSSLSRVILWNGKIRKDEKDRPLHLGSSSSCEITSRKAGLSWLRGEIEKLRTLSATLPRALVYGWWPKSSLVPETASAWPLPIGKKREGGDWMPLGIF